MPSVNPLTGQPWKAEEGNINPFSQQTVDPILAKITQQDYAGSLQLEQNRPVLMPDTTGGTDSTPPPAPPSGTGATGSDGTATPRPVLNAPESPYGASSDIFQPTKRRSLEDIRKEQLQQAQAMIDATQGTYLEEVARLKEEGLARLGQTSGIAVSAGLAGSPFMQAQEEQTKGYTNRIVGAKQNERQAQIASILAKAQEQSTAQYDKEQTRFLQERQQYVSERDTYQKQLKDQQDADKSAAITSIKSIAKGGLSLGDMDEAEYKALLQKSGLSDFEAKALFNENTPQANGKTEIQNNQLVTYYLDPVTGKPSFSTVALPDNLKEVKPDDLQVITTDDGVLVYDKNNPKKDADGNYIMQRVGSPKETTKAEQPKIVKIDGIDYLQNPDGTFTKPKTPDEVPGEAKAQKADEVVALIDELKNDPALDGAVGPISAKLPTLRGGSADFEAKFNNLIAKIAIENLNLLKGPMSDKDIQFIKEQAAALNLGMSEEGFKKELNKLQEKFREVKVKAGQTVSSQLPENDIAEFMNSKGVDRATAEASLKAAQASGAYTPSFSNDLSKTSQNGSLIKVAVAQKFPEGAQGGQCGDFAHKIVQFPSVGDSKSEKIASVAKFGIGKKEWQKQGPQIGDVLITNENPTYGHVAVVTEIRPDGSVVLSESNYKQKTYGREKVSHGRVISPNSAAIYGVIRGTLKV